MDTNSGKTCSKCGETKPLDEFYRHPQMTDGRLGKCKECTKKDVKRRYDMNPEVIAAYERKRTQTPHRKAKAIEYQHTRRTKFPEKYKARQAVANAIRDGRLVRQPCEVCGSLNVEAHHDDYSKPFDVRWLCFKHHREGAHGQKVMNSKGGT
jgi:hypothetical protein